MPTAPTEKALPGGDDATDHGKKKKCKKKKKKRSAAENPLRRQEEEVQEEEEEGPVGRDRCIAASSGISLAVAVATAGAATLPAAAGADTVRIGSALQQPGTPSTCDNCVGVQLAQAGGSSPLP